MYVDSIKRFFRQSFMSYKALFGFLDFKLYIAFKIINPVLQLSFFVLLAKYVYHTDDLTPWVIGNAIVLSSINAVFGVGTVIRGERFSGTLSAVVLSTCNRFTVFFGRAFMHIIDALITICIALAWGIIVFNADISSSHLLMVMGCVFAAVYAVSGFGLLIGSLGLVIRDIHMLLNTVNLALLAFSGANFPVSELPVPLRVISYCIPFTRSVEASKSLAAGSAQNVISLISQELLIGTLYMLAGYMLLIYLESRAVKHGDLDIY